MEDSEKIQRPEVVGTKVGEPIEKRRKQSPTVSESRNTRKRRNPTIARRSESSMPGFNSQHCTRLEW